ncbi:MAG: IPT/TIG domain-containing protein [Bacteroidota bacterium]
MKLILSKTFRLAFVMLVMVIASCKKDENTGVVPPTTSTTPQITSVVPKNPQTGDVVTITGTNFGATATDVVVKIGSTNVTISSVTNTEIKFTVPTGVTSGDLAVAIKNAVVANKDPQGVAITVTPKTSATPTFTAMAPTSGKVGDVVTLTGTNFSTQTSKNKVYFTTTTGGTLVLATVKTATATQLTVEVPASTVTGGVSIDVDGTNASLATGFSNTFTLITTTGTGGTSVTYINAKSGALNYSKIATTTTEIGAMIMDRANNWIYYSDYTILNSAAGKNTVYKVDPSGNNAPVVLSADARITGIVKLTTDAAGNVYALKYEGTGPSTYSIYKISPNGSTVTEVIKNFEMSTGYTGNYFFLINSANEICIKPGVKINTSGVLVNTETSANYGLQQKIGAAFIDGSSAYLVQSTDNNSQAKSMKFVKWDLGAGTMADAGFTPSSLFSADDAPLYTTSNNLGYLKTAVDDAKNLYIITDHSYQSGQLTSTWMIRKVAAGSTTSTLLGTFNIKFPTTDITDYNSTVEFISDARGNLYFKANQKDIIRITQ